MLHPFMEMFHFWSPYTTYLSESSTSSCHMCHTCEFEVTFMRENLIFELLYFILEASLGVIVTYPFMSHIFLCVVDLSLGFVRDKGIILCF
jgi:hypothetical protein